MNIKIGSGRRITIPSELFNTSTFKEGDTAELTYENDCFIIKHTQASIHNIDNRCNSECDKSVCSCDTSSNNNKLIEHNTKCVISKSGRKIVSNLKEGSKFKTKYYTPCKLVIRTKNRYIKDFCDDCRGVLLKDMKLELDTHKCPYLLSTDTQCDYTGSEKITTLTDYKHSTIDTTPVLYDNDKKCNKQELKKQSTEILNQINKNVESVKNKLDNKINEEQHNNKVYLDRVGSTVLQPVKIIGKHRKCEHCGEFYDRGFTVDGIFYCKNCTIMNFKKYFDKYKKLNK